MSEESSIDDTKLVNAVPSPVEITKPKFDSKTIKNYAKTRVTELIPAKENVQANKHLLNPFPALKQISGKQWLLMTSGFFAWTWDAFDYFSVSLNAATLAKDFDVSVKSVTWGITLVLMLRTVGAVLFGYLGDRYGRKWPLVINLALMCVLEIGTGFIKTYKQFLGVRACFGVIMGGIFGNLALTVLDDCPPDCVGFISGCFQQGYAFGYLLLVVFTRLIADNTEKTWRALFWFAAGCCFLITCCRALLPETKAFQAKIELQKFRLANNIQVPSFKEKALIALKTYWLHMIYMVFLMAGFNFMSHGSQDLFPTMLTTQLEFSHDRSTVTNCVANLGAIAGGIFVGHMSNFTGRRLAIMVGCILGGALIYPWAFIRNNGINAGAFFLQFMVQGTWGTIPVHLAELSPPEFRAIISGVAYQLGNLASSASSTIETTIGEQFPIQNKEGETIFDYGKVMAIFMGCVFGYVLLITLVGPENSPISRRNHNIHEEHQHQQQVYDNESDLQSIEMTEQNQINSEDSGNVGLKARTQHMEQYENKEVGKSDDLN